MVVSQKLIQKVKRFIAHEALVLAVDEAVPGLLLESAENVVVLGVKLNLVLVEVVEELISAEDLGDLNELIRVALAMEEGLLAEDHGGEHGAQTPHVQAVVVLLEVDKQLGALEVAGSDTDVVLGARMIEFSETPINKT